MTSSIEKRFLNVVLIGIGISVGAVGKYYLWDGGAEGMREQGRQAARDDARSQNVINAACEKSILNHPDQIAPQYILRNCAEKGYRLERKPRLAP